MSPTILKSLESQTRRDLAATAKSHGIAGWHGMRKQELVKAIAKIKMAKTKPKRKTTSNGKKNYFILSLFNIFPETCSGSGLSFAKLFHSNSHRASGAYSKAPQV